MEIVYPGTIDYPTARQISNARFDYKPSAIYYCSNDDDVKKALELTSGKPFRVRSGGHQHEGMCSGNAPISIIDVSRINHIDVDGEMVSIGPGAKLADVYAKMWETRQLLPGGGCGDVRVGGLVQGGGWGPYSRALGLTCDRLHSFHMIDANGNPVDAAGAKSDPNFWLYWAVSGAGGGNFGIVTDFRFHLAPWDGQIWQFTLKWDSLGLLEEVVNKWRNKFPGDSDYRLTTFCRLSAPSADPASQDKPVIISGFYLGEQKPLEGKLRDLLGTTYPTDPKNVQYSPVNAVGKLVYHPEYQPGPPLPPDLSDTCAGRPYPHKVSSCFPRDGFGDNSVAMIADWLKRTLPISNARRYLSLHCMGGQIGDSTRYDWSCFPYRSKPFMLQYQAWWSNDDVAGDCLGWVAAFRLRMSSHTEGAFINFPDRDLADDRKQLLRYYYANNLEKLIGIKYQYDRGDRFKFEMSIPTT